MTSSDIIYYALWFTFDEEKTTNIISKIRLHSLIYIIFLF